MLDELYPGRWAHLLIRLCGRFCDCPSPGKSPHVEGQGWPRVALARFEEDRNPHRHLGALRLHLHHGGNIGLCMPPNVAALDVDTDIEGGNDWSKHFAATAIELICKDHPIQISGKRVMIPNSNSPVAPGVHVIGKTWDRRVYGTHYGNVPITIRGVGNMIVVAPSIHRSGSEYEWSQELPTDPLDLPYFESLMFTHEAGEGRQNHIARRFSEDEVEWRTRYSDHWLKLLLDVDQIFAEGHRHEALVYLGWHLATTGMDVESIDDCLNAFAEKRCAGSGRFAYGASMRVLHRETGDIARDSVRTYAYRTAPAKAEASTGAVRGDITVTRSEPQG